MNKTQNVNYNIYNTGWCELQLVFVAFSMGGGIKNYYLQMIVLILKISTKIERNLQVHPFYVRSNFHYDYQKSVTNLSEIVCVCTIRFLFVFFVMKILENRFRQVLFSIHRG